MNWYQLHAEDVLKKLDTSLNGIHEGEVEERQAKYGTNSLQEAKQRSRASIFFSQFKDVVIIRLATASCKDCDDNNGALTLIKTI